MIKFCSLSSGSNGNCVFIGSGKSKLLVDCGLSVKRTEDSLKEIGEAPEDIGGILVSHEHNDHIKSLKAFSKKYDIPVYFNYKTMNALGDDFEKAIVFNNYDEFELLDFCVSAFSVPHDGLDPVGFIVKRGDKKIVLATDMGYVEDDFADTIGKSEILYLESNHDENMLKASPYPYWLKRRILGDKGHLSNSECGRLIVRMASMGTKHFILAHLSRNCNFPQLAFETTKGFLDDESIRIGNDVTLDVAKYDCVGNILHI